MEINNPFEEDNSESAIQQKPTEHIVEEHLTNPFEEETNIETTNSFNKNNPTTSNFFNYKTTTTTTSPNEKNDSDFSIKEQSSNSSIKSSTIDPNLMEKYQKLKQREFELDQKEKELNDRLESVSKNVPFRAPNWPTCKPIVYHNLKKDMPNSKVYRLVKFAYYGWYASVYCLLINLGSMLGALIVESGNSKQISAFILSIIFFIFIPPILFYIYRILYKAGRKQKKSSYIFYLIYLLAEIGLYIFFIIGVPNTGAGGIIIMIDLFKKNIGEGIVLLISTIQWGLLCCFKIWMWIWVRIQYRELN
jgi:hypothetical protein